MKTGPKGRTYRTFPAFPRYPQGHFNDLPSEASLTALTEELRRQGVKESVVAQIADLYTRVADIPSDEHIVSAVAAAIAAATAGVHRTIFCGRIYALQNQTIAYTADAGDCTYIFNGQETAVS